MAAEPIYKIIFMNQGKVYEIYARQVSHGGLFGFVEIEELVFGTRSSVVVDPSEERIQNEFSGVSRTSSRCTLYFALMKSRSRA